MFLKLVHRLVGFHAACGAWSGFVRLSFADNYWKQLDGRVMEHVYTVARNLSVNNPDTPSFLEWLQDRSPICRVSSRNAVAFTCSTNLHEHNPKFWQFNVYVADLNVAYEPHKVTTHAEEVTTIEWDFTGTRLMIGDCVGNIEVWVMKDHMLSEWTQLACHAAFPGESVLTSAWFHPGIKIAAVSDKKYELAPYDEKFSTTKLGPSVRSFGGRPTTGFLAISCSGLIWVLIIYPEGTTLTACDLLNHFRSKVKVVDICYVKDGYFDVITSSGVVDASINCYRVKITITNFCIQGKSKCIITSRPSGTFFLSSKSAGSIENTGLITHLKFALKEATQSVIIATSGPNESKVELWGLVQIPIEVNKIFRKRSTPQIKTEEGDIKMNVKEDSDEAEINEVIKTKVVWQHHATMTYSSPVSSIGTPRLSVVDSVSCQMYIMVAYEDGMMKCLKGDNMSEVLNLYHPNAGRSSEGHSKFGQKMQSSSPGSTIAKICDIQFTWTGCALVAIDALSQMFVYRISPLIDSNTAQMTPQHAQMVLEFCLISGIDAWDVILGLKSQCIESTCELLTSGFSRQSQALQMKYFIRFQELKGFLYRAIPSKNSSSVGQVKAGDAHTTIMLNSVSTFLKSLLRARDNQEKEGPAENLSSIIQTKGTEFVNVDKVLMELEHKEFFVEPFALLSVQNLSQWVADLTLYLLASLPVQVHNHYRFPGGSLINDVKSINLLRELLVVIRIWGLINEFCLPVFTRVSGDDRQLDVIAHLFKLLTKRIQTIGGEPDDLLLDECSLLPNQVLITQVDFNLKSRGVASPCLYSNTAPFNCIYFTDPSFLKYNIKTHTIDGAVICNSSRRMDVVRHVSLGPVHLDTWSASKVRLCTRCHSMSLIPSLSSHRQQPTSRSWEQRFYKSCPCGGSWS